MRKGFTLKRFANQGFTLIELLVTIGILAVVAAGVIAVINPADKVRQASDAKVANDISQIATAILAYVAQNNGAFPPNSGSLVPSELAVYPAAPSGYTAYTFTAAPAACTTACTSVIVSGQLKSSKYTSTPYWVYCTSTGKAGAVATATTCP